MDSKRRRAVSTAATVVALGAVALLFAACGGTSGLGVASLGSTTTTTSLAPASQSSNHATVYADAVKYAQCMRTHGVPDMPDPDSHGDFVHTPGKLNGVPINTNSAAYTRANAACQHLLPNNGYISPSEQQVLLAEALKYAECMRSHGISNFPDPSGAGGGVGFLPPWGMDMDSAQFKSAHSACRSLAPGVVGP